MNAVIGNTRMRAIDHQAMIDQPHALASLDALAVVQRYGRGQEIRGCSGVKDWFRTVSGVARRCIIRPDGRRQIVDILLAGDFFGLMESHDGAFTMEAAVEGTLVATYPGHRIERLAESDPCLAREIREVMLSVLARMQSQLLIMGCISAVEKVGCFLLEMEERSSDEQGNIVALPISRYDIADYLAISVETVSRCLTDLKHRGVIELAGARQIRIVDRDALADAA